MLLLFTPLMGLSRQQEFTFLEEVLFRPKYLRQSAGIVRWTRSPSLSVMSGNDRERKAISDALRELRRPLRPVGLKIERQVDGDSSADIMVFHVRFSDLAALTESYDLPRSFQRLHTAHMLFDRNGTLEKVYVFIDSRVTMTDKGMQRRALKMILAGLGLGGETNQPVASIFFDVPPGGVEDEVVNELTRLDVRTLRFVYAYVDPGATPEDVAESYDRNWRRVLD